MNLKYSRCRVFSDGSGIVVIFRLLWLIILICLGGRCICWVRYLLFRLVRVIRCVRFWVMVCFLCRVSGLVSIMVVWGRGEGRCFSRFSG